MKVRAREAADLQAVEPPALVAEGRPGRAGRRLWVLTTNDNVDALRFYQRRGFRLTGLHACAVDRARTQLKPEIPPEGEYGIPLRDELVLEKAL